MGVRLLYDTNIFLYYYAGNLNAKKYFDTGFLGENRIIISRIVRLELLSFSKLSLREENIIREMLDQFVMIPLNDRIEDIAIYLRRKYSLKIPDAIIAATAYDTSSALLTADIDDFKRVTEIKIINPFR
ncbi:MAG: type II toxin-antitoxin system VapC family toxin [Bacteroidota bacterium]|nr:type II toxin-antitoxin system VapC family toxin [Bacteroidota bacterium]